MISAEQMVRYFRAVGPNLGRGSWYRQFEHGEKFDIPSWSGGPDDIADMLHGRYWIASYAPDDGMIRWLSFDLDCTSEAAVQDCVQRYWALRKVMGAERKPIVWRTPSGRGLRVVYPIAPTQIKELIRGGKSGVVAEVLRAAGQEPKAGRLEIFPQKTQADRLPLGRNMPFLDPETLEPIPGTSFSTEFDPDAFERGLQILERALAHPFTDLPGTLRREPRLKLKVVRDRKEAGVESHFVRNPDGRVSMGARLEALVSDGLPGRGTRYESEFLIAMAMHLDPNRFAAYGVRAPTDKVRIARGVAAWLAQKHNGRSKEWRKALRCGRSGATESFVRRYLNPNSNTGETMIDRAQRAALNVDPLSLPVRQLSRRERDLVLELAETRYQAGAQRYRCEVWLAAFFRSVRENVRYHHGRGGDLVVRGAGDEQLVEVEILAEWLEAFPYGSGRAVASGTSRYVEYLDVLKVADMVELVREYRHHSGDSRLSRARTFHVVVPQPATLRDLVFAGEPVAPWIVKRALPDLEGDGNRREASMDQAYHDLYLASSGIPLLERYGRRTAEGIRRRAAELAVLVQEIIQGKRGDLLRAA